VNLRRRVPAAAALAAAALVLAGCAYEPEDANTATDSAYGNGNSTSAPPADIECAKGSIRAAGSTAQKNAIDEWVKNYQSACSGSSLNYQPSGSGAGIESFLAGQVAFAGSDSALKEDEVAKAQQHCGGSPALNLPMVVGPIAVAYNLKGVDNLQLKPETIAGIFSGKVTTWDDAAVQADNPDATLPSTPIQAFHRSDSSGTTDNFTKYLKAAAPKTWTYDSGKEWKAPGGQGAKGSDGVAQSVSQTEGGIGYMEASFADNSDLATARIGVGADYVALTPTAAGKAVEVATVVGQGNDLALKLDYATTAAGAYPIVLVTYEIVCQQGTPQNDLPMTKSFLTYTASEDGQAALEDLGYAPLPKSIRRKVADAVTQLS
jgi:phosphate transport system substrate-binding protein